ncbi:serine/threonine-protein kinase [Planctomyces sp. SH-PL62]|uniref:serine/threonine-protein kinase n=1 Tax=Planctomyces sp. SH-PL62 TaxID=1636152 RepID=UPI00078CC361|nr:serine/threonine-protein kinase [Planctomyces sp. SH-PL62]AMV40013.1 Serine/threonine-protein kinase PknB [Planctomyces sp. SH-PL62]
MAAPADADNRSTPSSSPSSSPSSASTPKDARGLSSLDESNLERSIIRRGLATPGEVEACKSHRAKLAAQADGTPGPSLLDVMVGAKVLTKGQMARLLQERGEAARKLEIPGYTIIEKLGKGSMGVVFKARQNSVNRTVAVKILLDSLAQNKEFIRRFEREAQIAAKLSHNNIVNAIDAGEAGGRFFFVMEYVEGPTIKDFLDKNKIFEEKDAVRIAMAVAEALKHANQRGLIHRDVKPENVILTKDGGVKLADLGLARLTGDETWGLSEAGMAIGTPYYISPEQVRGQTDVDIRADIYSLGATLYHMVTGKVPYGGDTPSEVMRKHVDPRVELVPPDHLNTKISSGLGMVIETMLAKNRENRYTTPDDLILDFKCLLQGDSPMIAGQKPDSLEALAEGEADDYAPTTVDEAQMIEMAGYVNARNQIIAALAVVLALSMVTNVLMLVAR